MASILAIVAVLLAIVPLLLYYKSSLGVFCSNMTALVKLSNDEKKRLALDWYMHTEKSQKEIAEIVGVSQVTLSKWVNDGAWEEQKLLETASKGAAIKGLYKRLLDLTKEGSPDDISKIAASIEKIGDKRATIPNIINVFIAFGNWAMERDPELAKLITSLQTEYIREKIRSES